MVFKDEGGVGGAEVDARTEPRSTVVIRLRGWEDRGFM